MSIRYWGCNGFLEKGGSVWLIADRLRDFEGLVRGVDKIEMRDGDEGFSDGELEAARDHLNRFDIYVHHPASIHRVVSSIRKEIRRFKGERIPSFDHSIRLFISNDDGVYSARLIFMSKSRIEFLKKALAEI